MKLESFFEKFELFADAPDAVVKMRELILESAIRGRLVSQNARDEPASALLRRFETESSMQGRKQTQLPPVGDDAYLQIPTGWAWTRLGNTGRIFNGDSVSESGKAELARVEDGLPFIATKDVGYGRDTLVYDNGLKVQSGDARFKVARANAVLICAEGGSAGRKIGIADREICFGNKLYANEVREGIHHRYIFYVYQAPTFFKEFAARMTGIIGGIARSEFLSLPIPLPPEEEQKRIVAKVDDLMALCDRLEVLQQERETQHAALARTSLARFADAPNLANLNFIFYPSYDIPPADLRKSILTLAVKGKLVPQDPNDEPAIVLLRKISDEKRILIAEKLLKKAQTPESSIDSAAGERLPTNWGWAKADDLFFTTKLAGFEYTDHIRLTDIGEIPVIRAQNVKPEGVLKTHLKYIDRQTSEALPRSALTKPALLVTFIGAGIGDVALFAEPDRWHLAPNVAKMEPFNTRGEKLSIRYLLLFMQSPFGRSEIFKHLKSTAQPSISMATIRDIDVPVPPFAEQRRIVAKVEQLMALVDALETQLATSRATAENLLSAVVAELTSED